MSLFSICRGRHCAHTDECYLPPAPVTVVRACTCGQMWMSILPPPPCPSHGQAWGPGLITWGTA